MKGKYWDQNEWGASLQMLGVCDKKGPIECSEAVIIWRKCYSFSHIWVSCPASHSLNPQSLWFPVSPCSLTSHSSPRNLSHKMSSVLHWCCQSGGREGILWLYPHKNQIRLRDSENNNFTSVNLPLQEKRGCNKGSVNHKLAAISCRRLIKMQ